MTSGIHQGPTSYGDAGFSRFARSVFLASAGYDDADTDRPIIGVGHSISDFTPCHRDMPALLEATKRGVAQAGGVPLVFPTMSLGEAFLHPLEAPMSSDPSLVVLFGSLAPDGAVIKTGAATPRLLSHRGPAVVFDGVKE